MRVRVLTPSPSPSSNIDILLTSRNLPTRADTLPKLEPNALLILAGTLHGIHAITSRLSPAPPPGAPSEGLQSFEAEGWGGSVYLTPTGEWKRVDRKGVWAWGVGEDRGRAAW